MHAFPPTRAVERVVPDNDKFAQLGVPKRVWAIGAIHGEVRRLRALHDHIGERFEPGERLVYLGNMIGKGGDTFDTIDELLEFRRAVLAVPGALAGDVVYLRGAQEEMWQKLLQIQFAPNPRDILSWLTAQGADVTLRAYGGRVEDGMAAAREGAVQLTRWTNRLREALRQAPGHTNLYAALRRAAFTDRGLLLVSAGLDPTKPMAAQGDAFWWNGAGFDRLEEPYGPFWRIVRGFDESNRGVATGGVTLTLDAGAGRGGGIGAALLNPQGEVVELFEC